jgi:hypothetical protein
MEAPPGLNRDGGFADFAGLGIVLARAGYWSLQLPRFAWCLGRIGLRSDYSPRRRCALGVRVRRSVERERRPRHSPLRFASHARLPRNSADPHPLPRVERPFGEQPCRTSIGEWVAEPHCRSAVFSDWRVDCQRGAAGRTRPSADPSLRCRSRGLCLLEPTTRPSGAPGYLARIHGQLKPWAKPGHAEHAEFSQPIGHCPCAACTRMSVCPRDRL